MHTINMAIDFVDGGIKWQGAQTGDFMLLCIAALCGVVLVSSLCIKRFSTSNGRVFNFIKTNFSTKKIVVCLSIISAAFLLFTTIFSTVSFAQDNESSDLKAYVYDDGSIKIDNFAYKNPTGYEMDIKSFKFDIENKHIALDSAVLGVNINSSQLYSGGIPANNQCDFQVSELANFKFSLENVDKNKAFSMVNNQRIIMSYEVKDILPQYNVVINLDEGSILDENIPQGWTRVDKSTTLFEKKFDLGTNIADIEAQWDIEKVIWPEGRELMSWDPSEGVLDKDIQINSVWDKVRTAKAVLTREYFDDENDGKYKMTFYFDNVDHSQLPNFYKVYDVINTHHVPGQMPVYPLWSNELTGVPVDNIVNVEINSNFKNYKKLTSISYWFNRMNLSNITGLENINMGNVVESAFTFAYINNIESLDLRVLDTSHITNMRSMFNSSVTDNPILKTIKFGGLFNTSNVVDMQCMFMCCKAISEMDISTFKFDNAQNISHLFDGCSALTNVVLPSVLINSPNLNTMECMFQDCYSLSSGLEALNNFDTHNVSSVSSMFCRCYALNSVYLDFDTSSVTDFSHMFNMYNDASIPNNLSSITLIGKFSTASAQDLSYMFNNCNILSNLVFSNWNTDNVINMANVFCSCSSLKSLNLTTWKTSNVTDFSNMFYGCANLVNLDLLNFNFSSAINMYWTFAYCSALQNLSLPDNGNTTKLSDINHMFYGCSSVKYLNLKCFNLANIKYYNDAFTLCNGLQSFSISKNWTVPMSSCGLGFVWLNGGKIYWPSQIYAPNAYGDFTRLI